MQTVGQTKLYGWDFLEDFIIQSCETGQLCNVYVIQYRPDLYIHSGNQWVYTHSQHTDHDKRLIYESDLVGLE